MNARSVCASLWIMLMLAANAWAGIPEPDAVLYGTITLDGRPVTADEGLMVIARVSGVPLPVGTYQMGDNADAGDQYVLRIRVESLAGGETQSNDAALIGQTAQIYVKPGRGAEKLAASFKIASRGITEQRDLVASSGNDCNGNQVADSDDIAGGFSQDCNANGVPDECEPASALVGPDCPPQPPSNGGGPPGPVDTDGDGVPDANDGCPEDPNKTVKGICGCGVADDDSDGDGVPDCFDVCPDENDRADDDGDGVLNCFDNCPSDSNKREPGVCGCGTPDIDVDGDAILDCMDNCPDIANPDQADADNDGIGDACDTNNGGQGRVIPFCGAGAAQMVAIGMFSLLLLRLTHRRTRRRR